MIESIQYLLGEIGEQRGGGVMWTETMLCVRKGNVGVNVGKDDPLHDFGRCAEECDWPVGSWVGWWFVGLKDCDDFTLFPERGYCAVCITVIYYVCEG